MAPKGAGALYVCSEPRIHLAPLLHGGGQERGLRSGTLATHQIAGMGKAFELARVNLASEIERLTLLRQRFCQKLADVKGVHLMVR